MLAAHLSNACNLPQVQLVLELCDCGTLREALDREAFKFQPGPDSPVDYQAVLETAIDVARGMTHLHAHNIIHADLKVRLQEGGRVGSKEPIIKWREPRQKRLLPFYFQAGNILLKTDATQARGIVAKISDFG